MKRWNCKSYDYVALLIVSLFSASIMQAQVMQLNIPDSVKRIVLNDYYTTYQYHDGMLAVQNRETGNWGFINEQGDLVHNFVWRATKPLGTPKFGGNACSVVRVVNGKKSWYVIDRAGRSYRIPGEVIDVSDYNGGYAIAKKRVGGSMRIVYLNSKGQEVFPNLSRPAEIMELVQEPFQFSEGLALYYDRKKHLYGYINTSGRIVIPATYDEARDFSEGLAAVNVSTMSGSRWGFIDKTGKWVIPAKFSNEPYPFIEGFSSVQKANGTCVAIDRTGEAVTIEFNDIRQFHKGYALVSQRGKRFASLIDREFQIVIPEIKDARILAHERFTHFLDYQNDCCIVSDDFGGETLLNYKGEEPFHTSSFNNYSIDSRYNKIMHCQTRGNGTKYDGFIDYNGNFIFMFVKDEF